MPIETDADRDVFFNTDEAGESFTVAAGSFNGIFKYGYTDEDNVESNSPSIETKFSNIAAYSLARDLTITRDSDSQDYKIRQLEPDGAGLVTLALEEQ